MSIDVADWLRGIGLEQYGPAFRENDIDSEVLPELTADDLIGLGVNSIGHRRKLLAAIAALRSEAPPPVTRTAPDPAPVSSEAERRQLTVMFCDLVGSTPLAARYDPEDLREVIGAYHRCVTDTVARFAGFVAKYMGDGVLIYFGYPEAHEDDPERAVRAGIAVIDAVGKLATEEQLSVRLGVASGLVVVGDLIGAGAAQERGVVGETPNLAARLQGAAQPGTLVIAESTRRQIGTLFEIEDLGPQPLAGFADLQRAWRVVAESGVLSRFEALRSETTPLVGRDEEIDLLSRRWQQAKAGKGRVVLISGEPGIGKSRLAVELGGRIEGEPHTRLRYFCSPYHQDSALYPFIAQLERAASFTRNDTVEQKLATLRALLAPGARGEDEIELLAALLSLPNFAADLNLSPQRKREKLFDALLHQLEALACSQPVLMVFEDAHWVDPTSRELLDLTFDRVSQLPVLLVVTFRPEFQHGWSGQPHVTAMVLNRLGGRDGAALVERAAGNVALSREIAERADGVPLFVEELTKAVVEGGDREDRVAAVLAASPISRLSIPSTLHASLIARLDRLGPIAKEVGQMGAVLGREFSYELIEVVARRPDAELRLGLDRLGEAGLLFCRGAPPQSSYLFKHALVQDAAYGTLLRARRQELHARVGETLRARFPEITEAQPETLAHHFQQARMPSEAVEFWTKAGELARQRSANVEAAAHLLKALELIPNLPTPEMRASQELTIQNALGQIHMATKGYASAEAEVAHKRASELCDLVDDSEQSMRVLVGLRTLNQVGGKSIAAKNCGLRCLEMAQRNGSRVYIAQASVGRAHTACIMGAFVEARTHVAEGLAAYDDTDDFAHPAISGYTPQIFGLGIGGWNEWFLGYPNRSRDAALEAVTVARRIGHPQSIDQALNSAAHACLLARDPESAQGYIEAALAIAREQGFHMRDAMARVMHGWALSLQGEGRRALAELAAAVADYRATGARAWRTNFLALLAQAYCSVGFVAEGLQTIAEARGLSMNQAEHWWDAELSRIEGDLHRGLPASQDGVRSNAIKAQSIRRGTSRPDRGSCALKLALPGCGANKAGGPKRAICSHPFTAGSPKASTPPI
ncbi:MAG TPA: AAA family ATPase [Stellaceae bacterium]